MHIFRRAVLLLPIAAFGARKCEEASDRVPEDPLVMNDFAAAYNRYAHSLASGVIDLKLWARVKDRWRRMTEA